MHVTTSKTLGRFARWGLIGVVVLMGIALLATVWATNRAVSAASDTLVRGQAEVFRSSLASRVRQLGARPTQAQLDELLAEHDEDGLRYIGIFDQEGKLVVQSGEHDRTPINLTKRAPRTFDDRVRVVLRPRRNNPRRNRRPQRRPRRNTTTVIEFQPQVSDELSSAATTSLAVGGIAGLGLIIFAVVLVRWYQRAEARERALAHERRLASLGQMSAVLAHEIRNPIASLKGNAQLLVKMIPEEGKPRSKAERLVEESKRIETLTNDLLEFARVGTIERTTSSPVALLRDAAASVSSEQISVDDRGAPEAWSFDGERLRQVLTNLLSNACQAGDGAVDARVEKRGRDLCFVVRDRGSGIPEEDLPHIFEPFYTKKTRGTGLGLAVAHRMVELHGGMIRAENCTDDADGGAVFTVTIPPS